MYIRTKNGRIAEVKENMAIKRCSENVLRLVYKDNQSICVLNGNDDIIDQSENLEELCDEFVGLIKSRSSDFIITKVIAHSLKELKDSLKTEFNGKIFEGHYDIIYGCIWIDKGLIYVAKMNESGELVLI